MPFGKTSLERLATCHAELQDIIHLAMGGIDAGDLAYAGIYDMTVLCGFRGQFEQDDAVSRGTSKVRWPNSRHNRDPSDAVDIAVYPVQWKAPGYELKMDILHAYVTGVARSLGIELYHISWDRPHIQRKVP